MADRALVTGASRGIGKAIAVALEERVERLAVIRGGAGKQFLILGQGGNPGGSRKEGGRVQVHGWTSPFARVYRKSSRRL